jgi:hypothetical protein
VADAVLLSKLAVSRPRRAGGRVQARVDADWNDGGPVVVGGIPSCRISERGTPLRATASLEEGVVHCMFILPQDSAGGLVTGRVSVSAPGAREATARFRFAVGKA